MRRRRRGIAVGWAFLRRKRHARPIIRGCGMRDRIVRRSVHGGAVRWMRGMRVRDGMECARQAALTSIRALRGKLGQLAIRDDGVPGRRQWRLGGVGGSTLIGGATLKRGRVRAPRRGFIDPRVTRRAMGSLGRGYAMMHRGRRAGICGKRRRFVVRGTNFHDRESAAMIRNSSSSQVRSGHSIRRESHAIMWTW